jgi:hypothetical protein
VLTALIVIILLRKTFDLSVLLLQTSVGKECNCVKLSCSKIKINPLLNSTPSRNGMCDNVGTDPRVHCLGARQA